MTLKKYRDILVLLFLCLFLSASASAEQKPDWVGDGKSLKYLEGINITGYGIAENEKMGERIDQAGQKARSDLSAQFIVKLQSEIYINEVEISGEDKSEYRNTVSAQTQIRMIDVDVIHWDDSRHKIAYALAIMKIEDAVDNYSSHLKELAGKLTDLIKVAEDAKERRDIEEAIVCYRKTFPYFIEAGETKAILQLLRKKDAFGEIKEPDEIDIPYSQAIIESRINQLFEENIYTAQNGAFSLSESMKSQWNGQDGPLFTYPFSYIDTDFFSQFSKYFKTILDHELTQEYNLVSDDMAGIVQPANAVILKGNYWIAGSNVRIVSFITDLRTGTKLASASVDIPKDSIEKDGIELKPKNFIQAMQDSKVFLPSDVIPGDLLLEIWSSKGKDNLIFQEGDSLRFYVRVNRPCNLQVIYHLANGVRLLLFQNHYVDESKANRIYTLPSKYRVFPPLGVERFHVFASTETFPEVATTTATFDTVIYRDVFAKDICEYSEYISHTRGIKPVDSIPLAVDKYVTVTTIPKDLK